MADYPYCPMCEDTRIHPQPFQDDAGRLLCGTCYFLDGEAVEVWHPVWAQKKVGKRIGRHLFYRLGLG